MSKTAREVISERKQKLGRNIDAYETMGDYQKAEEIRQALQEVKRIERELKR